MKVSDRFFDEKAEQFAMATLTGLLASSSRKRTSEEHELVMDLAIVLGKKFVAKLGYVPPEKSAPESGSN